MNAKSRGVMESTNHVHDLPSQEWLLVAQQVVPVPAKGANVDARFGVRPARGARIVKGLAHHLEPGYQKVPQLCREADVTGEPARHAADGDGLEGGVGACTGSIDAMAIAMTMGAVEVNMAIVAGVVQHRSHCIVLRKAMNCYT